METFTKFRLYKALSKEVSKPKSKLSIFSCREIGLATAVCLMYSQIKNIEICLIDLENPELAKATVYDLQNQASHLHSIKLTYGPSIEASKNSTICVVAITTTYNDDKFEDEESIQWYKKNIPLIASHSPKSILLIASYPFNFMTFIAWKLSGFPKNRVLGLGCSLDSIRFRIALAKCFAISPKVCLAWVIGVHLRTYKTVVWSSVSIAGTRLTDIEPNLIIHNDPQHWISLYNEIIHHQIDTPYNNCELSTGASITSICNAILFNKNEVYSISTNVKNVHSINSNIYLALPCIIGENGIQSIVEQNLTRYELNFLRTAGCAARKYYMKLCNSHNISTK